jgi:hypothetical protein
MMMSDPKQIEYEQAIAKLPADVLKERAEQYHRFQKEKIIPLQERINLITSVQTMKEADGELVRAWTKESKQEVLNLRVEIELLNEKATDQFWEGYEDLRPDNE